MRSLRKLVPMKGVQTVEENYNSLTMAAGHRKVIDENHLRTWNRLLVGWFLHLFLDEVL